MLIQIAKDVDVVAAKQISSLGPIKLEFINFIDKDQEELKKLRWEAMMLVTKANEYAIKAELKNKRDFNKLSYEEQWKVKENFYMDCLANMEDGKADILARLLEQMIDKHMKI